MVCRVISDINLGAPTNMKSFDHGEEIVDLVDLFRIQSTTVCVVYEVVVASDILGMNFSPHLSSKYID